MKSLKNLLLFVSGLLGGFVTGYMLRAYQDLDKIDDSSLAEAEDFDEYDDPEIEMEFEDILPDNNADCINDVSLRVDIIEEDESITRNAIIPKIMLTDIGIDLDDVPPIITREDFTKICMGQVTDFSGTKMSKNPGEPGPEGEKGIDITEDEDIPICEQCCVINIVPDDGREPYFHSMSSKEFILYGFDPQEHTDVTIKESFYNILKSNIDDNLLNYNIKVINDVTGESKYIRLAYIPMCELCKRFHLPVKGYPKVISYNSEYYKYLFSSFNSSILVVEGENDDLG